VELFVTLLSIAAAPAGTLLPGLPAVRAAGRHS
jgi:hypothetical protein